MTLNPSQIRKPSLRAILFWRDYIGNFTIPDADILEKELRSEQKALNENRIGLLESLR